MTDDGIRTLVASASLREKRTLIVLDLSHNEFDEEGVEFLAGILQENNSITLARALQNNRSLTTLDLGDNSIGNRGMEALAQVVEDNESLTTLSLQGSTMKNYDFQIIQNCQTQPVKREQTSPHRLIDIYD